MALTSMRERGNARMVQYDDTTGGAREEVVVTSLASTQLPAALGQATMANSLPVAIASNQSAVPVTPAAGELHIGQVGGKSIRVRVEKTRPNDTNIYAANDAINESASVGTNWTFAVGRIAAGTGVIVGAVISTDDVATSMGTLELDLYDDTITAINDNAEATQLYTNEGKFIRTLTFGTLAKKTANSTASKAELSGLTIPFACVGNSSIYGILRAVTGFTPVAQKKFTITLAVLQD